VLNAAAILMESGVDPGPAPNSTLEQPVAEEAVVGADFCPPRFALGTLRENGAALRSALETHSFVILSELSEAECGTLEQMFVLLRRFFAATLLEKERCVPWAVCCTRLVAAVARALH
jgi:hypothetical protein